MTPKKAFQLLTILVTFSLAKSQLVNNPLESGEWVPMRQPCPTCQEDQLQQKSGRVLNTVPFQRNYFPAQTQQRLQNPLPQPAALIQPSPTNNLTPQFLPHLEQAKFNPNFQQIPQQFSQPPQQFPVPQQQFQAPPPSFPQQYFLQPQPQYVQQPQYYPNLQQPQDDFHLLQQILNNPTNQQYVEPIYNFNQSQIQSFTYKPSTPKPTSTTSLPKTTEVISTTTKAQQPNEQVQLLYVPLETLRQRSPTTKQESITEKYQNFDFHKQAQLQNIQRDYAQQNQQAMQLQQQLQQPQFQQAQVISIGSTPKPTTVAPPPKKKQKLKPHQPPLAVFMGSDEKPEVKINDVLSALSTSRTITVLDQVTAKMPQVFVGPSNLQPPNGYAKFDLPYLSNLDSNRIQRKVEQLPFFVAPLSYNAPEGYSKIPFPAPHIGSVVVRDMKDLHNKPDLNNIYEPLQKQQPALNQFTPTYQISSVSPYTATQFVSTQSPLSQTPEITYFTRGNVYTSSLNPISSTTPNYHSKPQKIIKTPSTVAPITDYTVLEQFPIRNPTTHNILTNYRQTEQPTSTNAYSNFDLSKYRTHPLGINEEIGELQYEFQKQQTPSSIRPPISSTSVTPRPYTSYTQTSPRPRYTPSTTTEPPISHTPSQVVYEPVPQQEYFQPFLNNPNEYEQIYGQHFAQIPQRPPNPHYQTIPSYVSQNPTAHTALINDQQYIQPITTTEMPSTETPKNAVFEQVKVKNETHNSSEYALPPELPPINPNLPGMINSLEDGRLDSNSESSSQQPTLDTSTRRPSTPRTRQRRPSSTYTTTTISPSTQTRSRSPTSTTSRRRRPYNGRPRPEYEKYLTSTTEAPTIDITTPRPRTRYTFNQNELTTTEAPKRTGSTNIVTRNRFRSRGRPTTPTTTTVDDMEGSSTLKTSFLHQEISTSSEQAPQFQAPQFESGFEVSPPFRTQQQQSQDQYLMEEQRPVYQHEQEQQGLVEVTTTTTTKRPVYRQEDSEVISEPVGDDSDYVRFNGGTQQTQVVQTSTVQTRGRTRGRSRGRPLQHQQLQQHQQQQQQHQQNQQSLGVARSSTEAPIPADEEYYGFIRMPAYQQFPRYEQSYSQTERSSTESADTIFVEGSGNTSPSTINYPKYVESEKSSTEPEQTTTEKVKFIRPSSRSNSTKNTYTIRPPKRSEEQVKATKIRGRIRKPSTTTENEIEENYSVQPIQKTNRGHAHFQAPAGVEKEPESENYPEGYLQNQETYTKAPEFKITVAPLEYGDQIPYQSIHRSKVIKNPEDGSESQWSSKYTSTYFRKQNNSNLIPTEEKPEKVKETTENTGEGKSIFEQIFEEMAKFGGETSTETVETTPIDAKAEESVGEIKVSKGKRRGFWKRVRVRPIDGLETAESQNIGNTANLISDSAKLTHPRPTVEQYKITFEPTENDTYSDKVENEPVKEEKQEKPEVVTVLPVVMTTTEVDTEVPPTVISTYHQPEASTDIFESLFNILEPKLNETDFEKVEKAETTTTLEPTTEEPTTQSIPIESTETQLNETKIISEKIREYTERIEKKDRPPFVVGTSTSTEISHETEICYRGRCVKSNTTDSSDAPVITKKVS